MDGGLTVRTRDDQIDLSRIDVMQSDVRASCWCLRTQKNGIVWFSTAMSRRTMSIKRRPTPVNKIHSIVSPSFNGLFSLVISPSRPSGPA